MGTWSEPQRPALLSRLLSMWISDNNRLGKESSNLGVTFPAFPMALSNVSTTLIPRENPLDAGHLDLADCKLANPNITHPPFVSPFWGHH